MSFLKVFAYLSHPPKEGPQSTSGWSWGDHRTFKSFGRAHHNEEVFRRTQITQESQQLQEYQVWYDASKMITIWFGESVDPRFLFESLEIGVICSRECKWSVHFQGQEWQETHIWWIGVEVEEEVAYISPVKFYCCPHLQLPPGNRATETTKNPGYLRSRSFGLSRSIATWHPEIRGSEIESSGVSRGDHI